MATPRSSSRYWPWIVLGLAACEPTVDRSDAGLDASGAAPCPARIVASDPCSTAGVICPDPGGAALSCECRGDEWRCFERDGG